MIVAELVERACGNQSTISKSITSEIEYSAARSVLRRLGLWSAEVLEYARESPDVYQSWPEYRDKDGELRGMPIHEGSRVIVLPVQGDK